MAEIIQTVEAHSTGHGDPYLIPVRTLQSYAETGDYLLDYEETYAAALEMTLSIIDDATSYSHEAERCNHSFRRLEGQVSMPRFIGVSGLLVPRLAQFTDEKLTILDASDVTHFPLAVDYICRLATHPKEKNIQELALRAKCLAAIAVNHLQANGDVN